MIVSRPSDGAWDATSEDEELLAVLVRAAEGTKKPVRLLEKTSTCCIFSNLLASFSFSSSPAPLVACASKFPSICTKICLPPLQRRSSKFAHVCNCVACVCILQCVKMYMCYVLSYPILCSVVASFLHCLACLLHFTMRFAKAICMRYVLSYLTFLHFCIDITFVFCILFCIVIAFGIAFAFLSHFCCMLVCIDFAFSSAFV